MGFVESIKDGVITSRPHIIADATKNPEGRDCRWPANRYGEIAIEHVDNFERAWRQPIPRSLTPLSKIPELEIKKALAEIIGEPDVPKDWGGEEHDLFTTRIRVEGRPTPTAFLLKGPAQFREMTFAVLGKNGDQIDRLYKSPADLLVLQHCHRISHPVRSMMRVFATQLDKPRACLILDGYQTLRLLKAYRKCGLKPAKPLKLPEPDVDSVLSAALKDHPVSPPKKKRDRR